MKVMRPKNHSCRDISARKVFSKPAAFLVILIFLCFVIFGIALFDTMYDNKRVPAHNELAQEFNALPLEERQLISKWGGNNDIDPETFLMPEMELKPLNIWLQIYDAEVAVAAAIIWLAIFAVILSLLTFCCYWYHIDDMYYLCSLPLYRPYGWVLLFCMFVAWPFLLLSFIIMSVQHWEFYQAQVRKRKEARAQEKAIVYKMAEKELIEEAKNLTRPVSSAKAKHALIDFIMHGQVEAHEHRVHEAEVRLQGIKKELAEAGQAITKIQRRLGIAQASLDDLKATYATTHDRATAEAAWKAIEDARGVSDITYNKSRKRIEILIKVRVPYDGKLYDFGDYCLIIGDKMLFECKEVRSGMKVNHTSTAPLYHINGKHFCFGDSKYTIEEYFRNGRYVEAITLVVECLHFVNSESSEREIPNCFREVSTVEKAKRRIIWRDKLLKFLKRK